MEGLRFTAELLPIGLNYGVLVPDAVVASLGRGRFLPVVGTANGQPFHSRLVPGGDGSRLLYLGSGVRAAAELAAGSLVEIEIAVDPEEVDPEEMATDVDAEVASAISGIRGGGETWERYSPAERTAILTDISTATTARVRARRIASLKRRLRRDTGSSNRGASPGR